MKNKLIFIISAFVIIIALSVLLFLPYQTVESDMHLTVITGRKVGINTDTDALWFGRMPAGNKGVRPLTITLSKNSKVVIKAEGEMAPWIVVSKNNFKTEPGETTLEVMADVPSGTPPGNYTSVLKFYFYRDFTAWK
jgi:hypothetical protein|tara:strand:- start:1247 stop:1657 length:411 start_codon:yes stop_codon:yes gene_type:complete